MKHRKARKCYSCHNIQKSKIKLAELFKYAMRCIADKIYEFFTFENLDINLLVLVFSELCL